MTFTNYVPIRIWYVSGVWETVHVRLPFVNVPSRMWFRYTCSLLSAVAAIVTVVPCKISYDSRGLVISWRFRLTVKVDETMVMSPVRALK